MKTKESILPFFVPHYGCPYACVFCNQMHITGSREPVSPEAVLRTAEQAQQVLHPDRKRQLAFYGGSFTAIPITEQTALLEAGARCVQNGWIDTIRISTRPDAVTDKTLEHLSRYPVETIELGAQSMDDDVLALAGRGHTAASVRTAAALVREHGFRLILQMMTGLPGDTEEKAVSTAEELIGLKPDGVRIYPTVIIHDTALYRLWKSGAYSEHTVEDAVSVCARLLPLFEKAGIPVIRLGLNPTEELSSGEAAGGAYHPALGELVRSRVLRNCAEELLKAGDPSGKTVILTVPSGLCSQMTGQHRTNLDYLKQKYSLADVRVEESDIIIEGKLSCTIQETIQETIICT
ncbi:MAG: radical SAM protein [Oscillospiraceae bacterium]|nr:radical SAM protein [Oscillospiraceae bacterium]